MRVCYDRRYEDLNNALRSLSVMTDSTIKDLDGSSHGRAAVGLNLGPSFGATLGHYGKNWSTLTKPPRLIDRRCRGWGLGLPAYINLESVIEGATGFDRPIFPFGTANPPHTTPLIVAIGGGKGGVGKSLVTANLAVRLAATGMRVVAVDLDIGGANLHTYFGISHPKCHLADTLVYRRKSLEEILIQTPVEQVRLVAGGGEEVWGGPAVITEESLSLLFTDLLTSGSKLGIDVLIFDLGAGTHQHTLDFFLAAHLGIVTVLPEPTSIENAYLFMKTSLFRMIEHLGVRLNESGTAELIKSQLLSDQQPEVNGHKVSGYAEKLRLIAHNHPHFVTQLALALSGRTLGITMNQVRSQKDIDIGRSMELIGERYFGFHARGCGHLNYDEAAWKSLRNRRLLVVDFPHSILAKKFSDLAKTVMNHLGY